LLCEGVRRPTLVASPAIVERLDADGLDAAVAHEVAHGSFRDPAWGYLLLAVRALLFFNPAAQWIARTIVDDVERRVPIDRARTFVSVAGTATTMQAIALDLPFYDPERIHRTWLSRTEAERVLRDLVAMTNVERAALSVMAPGRGDVIVAGALTLVRMMRRFGFDRTLVSETDILDGLVLEMLAGDTG
jgi:hypothetical protein